MAQVPVQFGEWRPDIATLDTQFATEVENVFAGLNSYLPFPSLRPFSGISLADAGNDTNTKVLLHFDGANASTTFTDSNVGGSAHTWTAAGNAQINTASKKFGTGSGLFDGTGDWISTPDSADFALGSSDFTIDFWFNCDDVSGNQRGIAGQCDSTNTNSSTSFRILRTTSNNIQAIVSTGSGLSNAFACGTTSIFTSSVNTGWHHLAFVRHGNALQLFIDGVQESTNAMPVGASINNSTNTLRVGAQGEVTTNTWKGWIDEFRISVGVARWTDTFTPPRGAYFNAGGRVCGLYSARTSDGGWKIYAGTTTKLLSYSSAGWIDLSRTVGGAYSVPPTELWSFEQSGNTLVAVNINDVPQSISIDSGTSFDALGGKPPHAGHVKQLGDFLFLSRLSGTTGTAVTPPTVNNRFIVWSGINDITIWDPGTNLCDMQEFPDNGPVQGVAGSEVGYVVQDRGIRTLQFLPGDTTFIFNISRVLSDRGCISKYGFNSIGNNLYFVSEDGFYSISGQQVTPIGADKVNEWFLANSNVTRRDVVHCIPAVNKPRLAWVFHASEASPIYDKQIIFDWSISRWARASVEAQVWGLLASLGLDLDTTGTEVNDVNLDTPPDPAAHSLDSFAYVGGRPLIGAIDADGFLSVLDGPNLPATMETAEVHLAPGMRAFVSDAYPLDDARDDATGTVAAATRERLQDEPVWQSPVMLEITGSAALYSSSRLHRFRRFIPRATVWTHAQGLLIEAQQDGTVA